MKNKDMVLLLPFLQSSSYDLRIWHKSHLYLRIDRMTDPQVRIDEDAVVIDYGPGNSNAEIIDVERISKVTVSKSINIVVDQDKNNLPGI